ncbi:unnamed protein product [Allacma fusca]|uniref:Uncharacterized protein n=1 Tax=Allacma fusca TaxID=39272 RepID=A0A8J2PDE3_9HEXA|nr:unnamed protein product [Allacma fusca]
MASEILRGNEIITGDAGTGGVISGYNNEKTLCLHTIRFALTTTDRNGVKTLVERLVRDWASGELFVIVCDSISS